MFRHKRSRFTLIKQYDQMDCGPSCLAMIMSYYGQIPDILQIRNNTFLSRNGVSLRSIAKAAETIGFSTMGGNITFETLAEKANLPCIVYWDQEHFVVAYKIKRNKHKNLF